MIVEKGHFHFAEKYCGGQGPLASPVPTALKCLEHGCKQKKLKASSDF